MRLISPATYSPAPPATAGSPAGGTITLLLGRQEADLDLWNRYYRGDRFTTDRPLPLTDFIDEDKGQLGRPRQRVVCPGTHPFQHSPYGTLLFLRTTDRY